jgi:hypothetical protein
MLTKTCLQYCKSWVKKDIVGLAAHAAFGYVMATHVSLYLIHILHTCVTIDFLLQMFNRTSRLSAPSRSLKQFDF